jgi:phosphohistidine phosphatase SixA
VRTLEIRRHARRDPDEDRLSPEGRAQAGEVGTTLDGRYDVVFVSPAARAAETADAFLSAVGREPPQRLAIDGLSGRGTDGSEEQLAGVVRGVLSSVPEGGRGLAIGHTPLIEKAVRGLTGRTIAPLAECEGVLLTDDGDRIWVEELRLG